MPGQQATAVDSRRWELTAILRKVPVVRRFPW
jgi:hypothetical protein